MDDQSLYEVSEAFLRSQTGPFTAQEFHSFLKKHKQKLTLDEVYSILLNADFIFSLINDRFITKAAVFTNQWFSFKPTREEVKTGIFIPGHRFVPFLDAAVHPSIATLLLDGTIIPKDTVELSMNTILDLHALFGEGYSIPVIFEDPMCDSFSFKSVQYGLPQTVIQTGYSLDPYFKKGFEFGDRILCRIIDWNNHIIETKIKKEKHESLKINFSDMVQEEWFSTFEECMINQFERHGPCLSIQQQLSFLFLEEQGRLCNENCGAIDEFLLHANKIGFSAYGIESRIWYHGVDVPYIGPWNKFILDQSPFPSIALLSSEHIINCYIREMLSRNEKLENASDLLAKLYPKALSFTESEEALVLLHLEKRIDIVKNGFNRFIDFPIAKGRHQVILLFTRIMALAAKVSLTTIPLTKLPQQELVMLQQMADHTSGFLEEMEYAPTQADIEMEDILTSLNGMADAFESIEDTLFAALRKPIKK